MVRALPVKWIPPAPVHLSTKGGRLRSRLIALLAEARRPSRAALAGEPSERTLDRNAVAKARLALGLAPQATLYLYPHAAIRSTQRICSTGRTEQRPFDPRARKTLIAPGPKTGGPSKVKSEIVVNGSKKGVKTLYQTTAAAQIALTKTSECQ
jgi:hypothetical protein